ncbi:lysophospholipid transporter LplT [Shigella flexneri]|nr:lysophospholipid transporter LplT [Shigella flexneri]
MSESVHTNTSLWSKGMKAVIVAQFLSAFGDNALLFATLALLKAQFYPEWSQPILQMVFVGAYILLAPFVGQVADSFAKGRVMMFANGLKLLGAASICFGINPFLGYTLVGTSLFWGAGVTLRFLLVLWVPVALGITDNATPTYLNAMVAIGIVVGAGAAAKLVTLETVSRCMPAGILIGVVVPIFSLQHELLPAYALLMLIGVLGGFFVVPLNALLQERGKKSVGAGNAIAVQNLGENSAMLLMLGIYSLAVMVGIPVVPIGIGFGALFALAITALWIWQRRH